MKRRMLAAAQAVCLLLAGAMGGCGALAAKEAKGAYSSAEEVRPLLLGSRVPDVEVRRLDGTPVNLRQEVEKGPAVVIFYRGGW